MSLDRFLSRFGDDTPQAAAERLRVFRILLALVIATEYWTKALAAWGELDPREGFALAAISLLAAAVVEGRLRRIAFAGIALLQLVYVVVEFPLAGNHRYLELVLALLFAGLDDRNEEEVRVMLAAVRFAVVVVLFYAGLQKLLHGYYFAGQFLSAWLWRDSFRVALGLLLSADELARLTSYHFLVGDGPYRVASAPFLIASNLAWAGEIAVAGLLFLRHRSGWILGVLLVVVTELVARELMFGVEFLAAILLFAPPVWLRRFLAPATVLLAALMLMRLGILPEVSFH